MIIGGHKQLEPSLPPLERIYSNVTYFSIKCLYNPYLSPYYSHHQDSSGSRCASSTTTLGGRYTSQYSTWGLDINILAEDVDHCLTPWQTPVPAISCTTVAKTGLPQLQQQHALETIDRLSSSFSIAHHLYTDASLQQDGSARCAFFYPTLEPPPNVRQSARSPTNHRSNAERASSVSIQHYDHLLPHQHKYRSNGLMVR
ncbi:uncharacterized protein [Palaemon carinicauda]|uniref:uncharacterized protein n=1 Tax=Palaemon carinicauda TaxID=392227 RepID=UPI0035B5D204